MTDDPELYCPHQTTGACTVCRELAKCKTMLRLAAESLGKSVDYMESQRQKSDNPLGCLGLITYINLLEATKQDCERLAK